MVKKLFMKLFNLKIPSERSFEGTSLDFWFSAKIKSNCG